MVLAVVDPVFVFVSWVEGLCVVCSVVVVVVSLLVEWFFVAVLGECLLRVVGVEVGQSVDGCGIPLRGVVVAVVRPVGVATSGFHV